MTRRQLGKLAASAALLQRSGKGAPKYSGALDGSEDRVELSSFDSVSYARKLYESAPLELTFRATNRKQAELWQRKLGAKVTELLADFLPSACRCAPRHWKCASFPATGARSLSFRASLA